MKDISIKKIFTVFLIATVLLLAADDFYTSDSPPLSTSKDSVIYYFLIPDSLGEKIKGWHLQKMLYSLFYLSDSIKVDTTKGRTPGFYCPDDDSAYMMFKDDSVIFELPVRMADSIYRYSTFDTVDGSLNDSVFVKTDNDTTPGYYKLDTDSGFIKFFPETLAIDFPVKFNDSLYGSIQKDNLGYYYFDADTNSDTLAHIADIVTVTEDSITEHRTDIDINASGISTNVSDINTVESDVSDNVDTLSVHRTDIDQNATDITLKVSTTDYESDTAEIYGEIGLKLDTTTFTTEIKLLADTVNVEGDQINLDGNTNVTGTFTVGDDVSIDDGVVTADKIDVDTLSALTANMGTVTAGTLAVGDVEIGELVDGTNNGIEFDANNYWLDNNTFEVGDGTNHYFKFDNSDVSWKGTNTSLTTGGSFTASDATITGTITATGGYIGSSSVGWEIGNSYIYSTSGNIDINAEHEYIRIGDDASYGSGDGIKMGKDGTDYKFYAGDGTDYIYWDGGNLKLNLEANQSTINLTGDADNLLDITTSAFVIEDTVTDEEYFRVNLTGSDEGDVIIGDYSGNNGIKWDNSGNTCSIRGSLNANDITAGELSADYITTGSLGASDTITGGVIQTSASNQRVKMTSDVLSFYNDENDELINVYGSGYADGTHQLYLSSYFWISDHDTDSDEQYVRADYILKALGGLSTSEISSSTGNLDVDATIDITGSSHTLDIGGTTIITSDGDVSPRGAYTFPTSDGSTADQIIQTNASGSLSWVNMSYYDFNNLKNTNLSGMSDGDAIVWDNANTIWRAYNPSNWGWTDLGVSKSDISWTIEGGLGTTTDISDGNTLLIEGDGADIETSLSSTTLTIEFVGSSDSTLKTNIRPLYQCLPKIDKIEPKEFNWKQSYISDSTDKIGFLAQEMQKVIPEVIDSFTVDGEHKLGIKYHKLVPVLWKALQEEKQAREKLEKRIERLERAVLNE